MARTGERAIALTRLLSSAGFRPITRPAAPRIVDLDNDRANEALALYQALGGVDPTPILRPGPWDLALEADGALIVVELDEELHFNRYREATLRAPWYRLIPWVDEYAEQCRRYERRCLDAGSWGKRWTTPSADTLFGTAGSPGQLAGTGASRWKQRALYDAMKDLAAVSGAGPRLARLSINDRLGAHTLEVPLTRQMAVDPELLRELLRRRTFDGTASLAPS